MTSLYSNIFLVLDDREIVGGDVRSIVSGRRYGDITIRRRSIAEHFRQALPDWARDQLTHLFHKDDLAALRNQIEHSPVNSSILIVAGRAGFLDAKRLTALVERLPYAQEAFTDRLYKPLVAFLPNAHELLQKWADVEAAPLHLWETAWQSSQRLASVEPLDLAQICNFLFYSTGSTATRHFNEMEIDTYYYTKWSTDKRKMLAEYSFYGLAPESMRPWLLQPFDYQEESRRASYKMLRYYLADAALQWVHGAFDADSFGAFVDRLLFFIDQRSRRTCTREQGRAVARELFVTKVEARMEQFLCSTEGQRINALAVASTPELDLRQQVSRYLKLYTHHELGFASDYLVVGHGDPCFSNVLYDAQRFLMKFIDPKGAVTEADLWTHPLYDLCKISHSALGDYDFINNGLYGISLNDRNALQLNISLPHQASLKPLFVKRVAASSHDPMLMRLGEASLFLSMLPLHIDYPNKVVAFLMKAKQILDEVECERIS
jgi:hypothetical protein